MFQICPQSATIISALVFPDSDPKVSNFLTKSCPDNTFPKTVCFPSSHGHLTKVMKN